MLELGQFSLIANFMDKAAVKSHSNDEVQQVTGCVITIIKVLSKESSSHHKRLRMTSSRYLDLCLLIKSQCDQNHIQQKLDFFHSSLPWYTSEFQFYKSYILLNILYVNLHADKNIFLKKIILCHVQENNVSYFMSQAIYKSSQQVVVSLSIAYSEPNMKWVIDFCTISI